MSKIKIKNIWLEKRKEKLLFRSILYFEILAIFISGSWIWIEKTAIEAISEASRVNIAESTLNPHYGADKGTEMAKKEVFAYITGFNTVPSQTDSSPCWAGGEYICGRNDVVACPREYPKGTKVEIEGDQYVCLDRTAEKYNGRWDISCDKDFDCPFEITGYKKIKIIN